MRSRIFSQTGVLRMTQSILVDVDSLWRRFGCEDKAIAEGYEVVHFDDEMALRKYYEFDCMDCPNIKRIMVIDDANLHIPFDIANNYYVIELSLRLIFSMLDDEALLALPGLDFDHLAFIADKLPLERLNRQETISLCTEGLRSPEYAQAYTDTLMDKAVNLAEAATTHRDWTAASIAFGKASMFKHSGIDVRDYDEKRKRIEAAFQKWIHAKYAGLSGTVDRKRPVLLSKVNDFIRRSGEKVALIVMDGMSFENFFTIKRMLAEAPLDWDVQASFSFFPTVTSVARQSIFSGKLPLEHVKPFSLENEEKQWYAWWQEHGYKQQEIAFFKDEEPDIPEQAKIVGIVVNICDELMHDELQGLSGLQQGIETWTHNGHLVQLIETLRRRGFSIFMTADHGNTSARAEGRFTKPGVLAEPASRRAVIYQSFVDALELAKFKTQRYDGAYLPDGYNVYLFTDDTCYGDRGKEYITHGGMTLEETVVPFVQIGAFHG